MATFDREAAKAAGYSDEEIDKFLADRPELTVASEPEGEPPAPTTEVPGINRAPEIAATALPAAGAAAAAYGTAKTGQKILEAMKGAVAPTGAAPAAAVRPVAPAPAQGAFYGTGAAPAAAAEAAPSIASRMAPYVQAAGRAAPMALRAAGPAGMVASAAPEIRAANIGPRVASGEIPNMMQSARQAQLNMPTPAPLTPTEARNLLASGDERMINMYGGRKKLVSITDPNAINSGFTNELALMNRK